MPIAKLPPDFPEFKLPPKEYWEDKEWVNEHFGELSEKYPDYWIAVYEGEVVSANKNLGEVKTVVRSRDFNHQCVYVYVEDIKRVLGLKSMS